MRRYSGPIRTLGLVVLSAAIALACSACRCGTPTVGGGKKLITLKYLVWADDTEIEMNQHWIEEFEASHPGVRIDFEHVQGNVFDQKLLTQVAGNVAPDVTYVNPSSFPNFLRRDVFLDLKPYMDRDGVTLDEFLPGLVDPYEYDGGIYGLPRSWHPFVIFYNKRLFDRFGVEYPDDSWTWDDFIDAGQRLTIDEDGDGAKEFFGAANFPRQVFIRSYGGNDFGPDGEFLLDEPESIEGLELYIDLINKYEIFPSPSETRTQAPQQMFETGRLAMFSLGIWSVPAFRRLDRFEWDIAIMPRGPAERNTLLVTAGWAITRTSEHPEEAWELVKYLSGREAQEYQMKIWRDPSPRVDAFNSLMFWEPEKPPANREAVLKSIEFGEFDNFFLGQPELANELNREMENLESGRSTDVEASVAEMRRLVERRRQELVEEWDL
ncbi:MAG: extracellular solute-binding protein [Armatimonadia bacterium]|nr:extracellular solute-binding protein [Armatimonadia bacterium]